MKSLSESVMKNQRLLFPVNIEGNREDAYDRTANY